MLGQAIYYDNLLGDDLTEEDFEKARTAMRDAIRITTARRTFMKRLNEYRKDPLALSRNRRKIDNENAKKEKTKQDIQNDDEIDNASVQDIVQGADDGDYVLDGLDDIIEGLCRFEWVMEVIPSVNIIDHIDKIIHISISSSSSFG